jgi:hypothetical protein
MKKLLLILLLFCGTALAQKYDAAVLYSHIYMVPESTDAAFGFNGDVLHFNGGGGQFAYNKEVAPELFLGAKTEVMGYACTRGGSLFTYTVGPQAKVPVVVGKIRANTFVHALLGAGHGGDHTGFAMVLGGGVDFLLPSPFEKTHVYLRPVEIDYLYSHIAGPQDSVRYAGGLVFNF